MTAHTCCCHSRPDNRAHRRLNGRVALSQVMVMTNSSSNAMLDGLLQAQNTEQDKKADRRSAARQGITLHDMQQVTPAR